MSSFISLDQILSHFNKIEFVYNNKYKIVDDYKKYLHIIFYKWFQEKSFNYFFPIYNNRSKNNFFYKISNYITKIFLHNHNIIFTSGDEYGMNNLNNKIKNIRSNFSIIKIGNIDTNYFKIIKNIFNLFLNKRNYEIYPTIEIKNDYSLQINEILKSTDYKLLSQANIYLLDIVIDGVNYIENLKNYLINYFENSNVKYFFAHHIKLSNSLVLGDISNIMNSKTILMSHGVHSSSKESLTNKSLEANARGMLYSPFTTYTLIQSKISYEAFKNYKSDNIPLKTFPLMWGKKKLKVDTVSYKKHDKKVILHASTFKSYFVRPWIYESAYEYIISLNKLILAIREMKDVTLIIRVRPTPECNFNTIKDLLIKSDNVIVKKDGKFIDDLNKSSLLISYSSTTIEEAIYERIPVAILGYSKRFNHFENIDIKEINGRSVVYKLKTNIKEHLLEIMDKHFNKPLTENEIKQYVWTNNEVDLQSTEQFLKL